MPMRSFWGWGNEGAGPSPEQRAQLGALVAGRFGIVPPEAVAAPTIDQIDLPRPRWTPPSELGSIVSQRPIDRAAHTYGKAFRDIVRGLRRDFRPAPDAVAYPNNEADLRKLLDVCARDRLAAIPFGGGSSVVGGVEARIDGRYRGALSIDLSRLDKVLEIDRSSRAARIQAGIFGPALEDQLRPHGLTLRHFPQSFEFSTLGGWIATRSGGHYATLYTHIDEFVESLRVVSPAGVAETRRLPGSGAGPSPDRFWIGSEGTLGIITEAWMRLQDRPRFRAAAAIRFASFPQGAQCVRLIAQAGLFPSNLRLLDAGEALTSGAGDGTHAVLLVAFESADHSPAARMERAIECCRDHGGLVPVDATKVQVDSEGAREGSAGAWRNSFLGAPYLRDALAQLGMITETFETAVTWDRFEEFDARIRSTLESMLLEMCGGGTVTCRFTHAYPDGPAPYFTIIAPSAPDRQLEQWDEIKIAAGNLLMDLGATITHHHAVGRDHRPWYDREQPELFRRVLAAAKRELDPQGILNPHVLVDPEAATR